MKSITYYLKHYNNIGLILLGSAGGLLPDKVYLKMKFRLLMGYPLNIKDPKTFAEKLQWLKLYDRKPIYHKMVDKVESKAYINSVIGAGYTIPSLGVYDCFEQIDWDSLPQQFILKATHDSGSYYIVTDKEKVDKEICRRHLYIHWNKDYYKAHREWQYKGLKSRIIAEPLIANPKELCEYKFFCFNGEPRLYQTCYDRDNSKGGAILNFFDLDCHLLNLKDKGHTRVSDIKTPNPVNLTQMIHFCKLLAKDTFFVRVDFYEINGSLYIGELTLQENAGFCSFTPDHWNFTMGEWIHLPKDKR